MSSEITSTVEWRATDTTPAGPAVRMGDLLISRVAVPYLTRGYGAYFHVWRETADGGREVAYRVEHGHSRGDGTLIVSAGQDTKAAALALAAAALEQVEVSR